MLKHWHSKSMKNLLICILSMLRSVFSLAEFSVDNESAGVLTGSAGLCLCSVQNAVVHLLFVCAMCKVNLSYVYHSEMFVCFGGPLFSQGFCKWWSWDPVLTEIRMPFWQLWGSECIVLGVKLHKWGLVMNIQHFSGQNAQLLKVKMLSCLGQYTQLQGSICTICEVCRYNWGSVCSIWGSVCTTLGVNIHNLWCLYAIGVQYTQFWGLNMHNLGGLVWSSLGASMHNLGVSMHTGMGDQFAQFWDLKENHSGVYSKPAQHKSEERFGSVNYIENSSPMKHKLIWMWTVVVLV